MRLPLGDEEPLQEGIEMRFSEGVAIDNKTLQDREPSARRWSLSRLPGRKMPSAIAAIKRRLRPSQTV